MVGRTEEKKLLQSLLKEDESQFVAVFGRRRVGKTFLIRESFDYKFTFQHTGISTDSIIKSARKKTQLEEFSKSLAEAGFKSNKDLSTWYEALSCLSRRFYRNIYVLAKCLFYMFKESFGYRSKCLIAVPDNVYSVFKLW